jgi:outer membrane usher protein FimD/PapC
MKINRLLLAWGVVALAGQALLQAQYQAIPGRPDRVQTVSSLIIEMDRLSTDFRRSLDRALDRSRMDGTFREDYLNREARKLEIELAQLRNSWNRFRNERRSRRNVSQALQAAGNLDRSLSRHVLRGRVQREWYDLSAGLDRLADAFNLRRVRWERWVRVQG